MAGNLSNYLENKILDHVLGRTAFTMPTVYVALFTTDPTDAGTGTEVTGGAYARQPISFNAAANGASGNSALVAFPTATAPWGTITHAALYDALTGGNMLWHGPLGTSVAISSNQRYELPASTLTVGMD